ncbi:hypothetical protein HOY80DRAFT_661035 [Tuber brumale]|nr:hypothetical protein HOY80DRAFT_661035 [Tuber brumale]
MRKKETRKRKERVPLSSTREYRYLYPTLPLSYRTSIQSFYNYPPLAYEQHTGRLHDVFIYDNIIHLSIYPFAEPSYCLTRSVDACSTNSMKYKKMEPSASPWIELIISYCIGTNTSAMRRSNWPDPNRGHLSSCKRYYSRWRERERQGNRKAELELRPFGGVQNSVVGIIDTVLSCRGLLCRMAFGRGFLLLLSREITVSYFLVFKVVREHKFCAAPVQYCTALALCSVITVDLVGSQKIIIRKIRKS